MNTTRRGFLGLLGLGAGAAALVTAPVHLSIDKVTFNGVEITHERHPKMPAAWLCHGVVRDGKRTFALDADYTDADIERLGRRVVVDASTAFVVAQLTGPERDFFGIEGLSRPKRRQRWIAADGSLDWRNICDNCMERMEGWKSRCSQCERSLSRQKEGRIRA